MSKRISNWKVMVLIIGFMAQPFLLAEASDESQTLYTRMTGAWQTVNTKYYHPGTSQYYTAEPSQLPTAQQVQNLDPDDCGYGTGMDDVPLFGGTLLVSLCDQYDVTQDVSLKAEADKVFAGLELCVTGHGVPGFVARGICPEDGESIYICSSRDQYTNLVHGMWRYYHSPLCDEESQSSIQDIFRAIADRMIQNVTPQNNYDFLRDGKVDGSDVTILAGNWQAGIGDPNTETITWEMGDFNGDGQIDGSDVTILAGNWQYGVEATASAVPEPGAIVLLLYGLVSLFLVRRC